MDYQEIRYEQDGPVTIITIDRAARMNAIDRATAAELLAAWTRFRDDPAARVAVLTGAGEEAFCAGGDLKAAFAGELVVPVVRRRGARARPSAGILGPTRWTDLHKPTIAAVNGVAYAGGLEWACWTDLCIADAHATFGVTCRRWNIGLGDGGTQRLPRIVGFRVAMELILTGRVIGAEEARRIGLVNEVVASGTCRERAVALAHSIAALPAAGDPHRPRGGGARRRAAARGRAADRGRVLQPAARGPGRARRRAAPLQRARSSGPRARRRGGHAGPRAAAGRRAVTGRAAAPGTRRRTDGAP